MRIAAAAAALLLASLPCAAQDFAGAAGLGEALAGLRFTPAPPAAAGAPAVAASVSGAPVTAASPDVGAYPVRGMDVSTWQGAIDWSKIAAAGVSFVYIKATEGTDVVDDQFQRNWAGASRAGLRKGAYHFWNFCESGSVQAAHFIKTVPREGGALPPTIDIEQSRDCRSMPSKEQFQKSLTAFLAKVEKAYRVKPVLYVNYSIYETYLAGADRGLKLWISDPHHQAPRMPQNAAWTLWQYSYTGRLPGIDGAVDLDVFQGTPEMLAELGRPDQAATMLASAR